MTRITRFFLCLTLLAVILPAAAHADYQEIFPRQNKTDLYLKFSQMQSKQLNYYGPDGLVPLSLDYSNMFGFGLAWHTVHNLAPRFEILMGNTRLRGHGPAEGFSSRAFISTGSLNLDWNMFKKKFTPFISGGLGWQYFEVRQDTGYYSPGYWHPWYGYVGGGYYSYPVHYETSFMWNAALGVRYDINYQMFIKAYMEASWVYFRDIHDPVPIPKYGFAIGASY